MKDFLEWSTLRVWVKDWLRYCRWDYCTLQNPDVNIQEFFNAPIVNRKWKITRTDPHLVRFGLLWKIFDMVAGTRFSVTYTRKC
ncbi:Mitochondrial protein [Dorcoceras hygrometricum]|uniref:Mitochondrial protein n=1 Tax=Dorcoceras hygrometricum TaxID=472368 RepID=A0A2Z7D4Z5_9LAMI|nr:Mitochondrial protein [Dorcoceras hygrometricum]